jgi:hypothetical protein
MRKVVPVALILLALFATALAANLPQTTTTLSAQTSNNTSAANSFASAADGNLGASNISKVPIRTLLYAGAATKLYAHVEPWWGSSSHIDIGYSSQDPTQIQRQVTDMISRGLDGLAVDWYGPGSYEDLSDKLLLTEVEQHPGFGMFIEIDHGAIQWHSCWPASCDGTTAAINLFTTVANQFFSSPAYVRIGGRPVVREFGMENYGIDWNAVQAAVPGNPLIVHRDNMGFTDAQTGGSFGWIQPMTLSGMPANYDGMDYVNSFYTQATGSYPAVTMFATVFKGFNDILASWAPSGGRHVEQNCGQTWLRSFAAINKYYSASKPLPALQLVTWNDYEEGTEVESGIDNCVTVSGSVAGNTLQWSITGDETTVDHYTVYISTDGQNLMSLGDLPAGTHSRDLSGVPSGAYSLFVQAVGKPVLKNQMSAAINFTSTNAGGNWTTTATTGSALSVSASPASATVAGGQPANFQLAVSGGSGAVALSCSNLPAGMSCSFSPASVTPGANPAAVALAVTTSPATAALHPPATRRRGLPALAFWMSGLGVAGLVSLPQAVRRNRRLALLALVLGLAFLQFACGGGGVSQTTSAAGPQSSAATAGTYTITVNATSGASVASTDVSVTVH